MVENGTNFSFAIKSLGVEVPSSPQEFEWVLNVTATVSTILQYLIGSSMCLGFIRKRTTGEASSLPFVSGAVNCVVWYKYGVIIEQPAMQIVYFIGFLLFFVYTLVFYQYCIRRINVLKQSVCAGGFLLTLIAMISVLKKEGEEGEQEEKSMMGYMASIFSVIFSGAPLASLGQVFRSHSTSSLPFSLICMMFIVTAQWTLLGVIIDDNFVFYPNLIGCILAAFQLILFLIFPSSNGLMMKKKTSVEEHL